MSADATIITGMKKGSKAIFKQLYEHFYKRLYYYAVSYVDQPDTAKDIVQELFFHLWQKRETIEINTSVSSYLFRAIHNRCIQYLRHQQVVNQFNETQKLKLKEAELLYHHDSDFIHSASGLKEMENEIKSALESLSPRTKEIFMLSREKNLKNSEISKKLNVDIKTVEYHIGKALKTLRIKLSDYL